MAIHIASNTESDEELRQMFADLGDVNVIGAEGQKPPVEGAVPPSEPEGAPGGGTPVEPKGEIATAPEPVETKPRESPTGEPSGKGGYKAKIDKLTARTNALREEIDEERGSKASLRAKLEAAEAELAALKGGGRPSEEAPIASGPARPKRPKMPDLSDPNIDFDADKFSSARRKYEGEIEAYDDAMVTYFDTVAERKAEQRVEVERQRQAEDVRIARRSDRIKAGIPDYPDYDEILERVKELPEGTAFPTDKCSSVNDYIEFKAKHTASLYRYFMLDFLDDDGAEGKRIAAMDPMDQVIELHEIESRLAQERTAKKTPPATPAAPAAIRAAAATPREIPATPPKPTRKVPDEPLDTVGGHGATASAGNLEKQAHDAAERGDFKEFKRLSALVTAQNVKRRAG